MNFIRVNKVRLIIIIMILVFFLILSDSILQEKNNIGKAEQGFNQQKLIYEENSEFKKIEMSQQSVNMKSESAQKDRFYAEFVGQINAKPGNKWYKAETRYTTVYFYNRAVDMEWMIEEIDDMYQYLLSFRDLSWDGEKVAVYLLDEDEVLMDDPNYELSGYDGYKNMITLSADFASKEMQSRQNGKTEIIKEDPRLVLVHEFSHHIHMPHNLKVEEMWLDEGLAYYLAFHYPFREIAYTRYPEEAKMRKITDFLLYMDNQYNYLSGIKKIMQTEFVQVNKKTQKHILTFEGLAKAHYKMEPDLNDINKKIFEASIIEFLIDTYGKDKLVSLYQMLHDQTSYDIRLEEGIFRIYYTKIEQLEEEWRKFIDVDKIWNLF